MRKNHCCTPFGKRVKIRLLEMNMTSKELAEMIGMADSTVCDVIFGRNNRVQTQQVIAQTLGIEETDL